MNLTVKNTTTNRSETMATGLINQLAFINVRQIHVIGYIVSTFDYKVIMKDGMVPFEFQLEITTMAIELNTDIVIILSQGSFMSMVLVMYIRSVIIQMFIVMNIFTQFSLFGYYSHISMAMIGNNCQNSKKQQP